MNKTSRKTPHQKHHHLTPRINRVVGQLQGVSRMIDKEHYCVDILQQLSATQKALDSLFFEMMKGHIDHCVLRAIEAKRGEAKVDELLMVLKRYVR